MANGKQARLAVLIDADNASARIVEGLFEEIAKFGSATVRRVYGDFSSASLGGWVDVLAKHAIAPQQQFANTKGKNASDIALVIDAMDLLHSARLDGFCLVSSDSDFTRLAGRLREEGVEVYGFGEQKTPPSFRQACTRFIYTENLGLAAPEAVQAPPKRADLGEARMLVVRAIREVEGEGGWVNLAALGSHLIKLESDFDPRSYGEKKLSELVRKFFGFEVRDRDGQLAVRLTTPSSLPEVSQPKPQAKKAPKAPKARD
ncbi:MULTISPECIES: NYN domain-containing protein [unclassified Devosia]|uniref:NYN domain-containing protein n=1 Tax=unclassified Devosia TaxID=196773 RepID=UPI0008693111|nr:MULTISPECIES: NYN domain-containing protein [unclassified Devosia]MBN9363867.1 NYN domain-containing protein [Devosia sp.]ODS86353.1 MAG: Maebl [Devosia sp. SCN 66-27]OJX27144.1 MAG: Maebl [Devosia sp. 66-14]